MYGCARMKRECFRFVLVFCLWTVRTYLLLGVRIARLLKSRCAFLGTGPSTQFGLIEIDTCLKPNWILGAVQKSHVQQRFRRTAPARLTRLLKSIH